MQLSCKSALTAASLGKATLRAAGESVVATATPFACVWCADVSAQGRHAPSQGALPRPAVGRTPQRNVRRGHRVSTLSELSEKRRHRGVGGSFRLRFPPRPSQSAGWAQLAGEHWQAGFARSYADFQMLGVRGGARGRDPRALGCGSCLPRAGRRCLGRTVRRA